MSTEDEKKTRIDAMVDKIVNHDLPYFEATISDPEKMRGIMAEIKAERERLDACPRHSFAGGKVTSFGAKYLCLWCGGKLALTDISNYIRGYVAAGADANDIWPGWK